MGKLAEFSHKIDHTRLVSAACFANFVKNVIDDRLEKYLDIIGINEYYGWYSPDFKISFPTDQIITLARLKSRVISSQS